MKYIVIHAADTPADMDIGAEEINRWHLARGWNGIGYHYVIRRDGALEKGRDLEVQGAHVRGHNHHSVGVCMVGGRPDCNYTTAQWVALHNLVDYLARRYPEAEVVGHRDLDPSKECPCFEVRGWWEGKP